MKSKNKEIGIIWPVDGEDMTISQLPTINIEITQDNWCGYEGECKKDMAKVWDICFICKHRIKLDIPAILDKKYEEQERKSI